MYHKRKRSQSPRRPYKRFKARQWGGVLQAQGYRSTSSRGHPTRGTTLAYMDGRLNQTDSVRIRVRTYLGILLTSTTGSFGYTTIKLSSLFQPFFSIASNTHQNPTVNNLVTLYSRYRVDKAYISASAVPTTGNVAPMQISMGIWDNSYVSAVPPTMQSMNEGKHTRRVYTATGAGFTGRPSVCRVGGAISQFFGMSPQQYQNSDDMFGAYNGSALGDPNQWIVAVLAYQTDDGSSTSIVSADLVLTQYVTMFSRRFNA